jgi:hypothetical protein
MTAIDLLDGTAATRLEATVQDAAVLVAPADFAAATGWELKPEGLCRGGLCVALRAFPGVVVDDRIDLVAVAAPMQREVLADIPAGVVAYGEHAAGVGARLAERVAADFTLADLDGKPHTFSAIGRKKKLLVTWASW